MISLFDNMYAVLPEITILVTASLAIIAELFCQKKVKQITLYVSLVGLVLTFFISLSLLGNFKIVTLGGLFISDDMAQIMKLFIYVCVFLTFVYSKDFLTTNLIQQGDFYILGLFSTLGMLVLVSAHSLVTVYLGLELLSLPLYAMVAMQRNSSNSSESAMKYFVMGAIASAMMLYGFSLLFGATGKLDLMDIANAIAANAQQDNLLLSFALVFIVAGIGFKLAAAPFHMWAPDVYEGAPTAVTLFVSSAPKIAALGMAFRLLTLGLIDISSQWQQLLIVMALLSTGLGNLLAVSQVSLKRLFAYSAIAHSGYALFGIAAATPAGFAAALYYIIVYALMSAAVFGLLVLLSKSDINIETIDDLKGLNKRRPWLAFLMLITLFSMAGVPPTVGFFTKLLVLKALVDVHLTWIAVLGLLFAVIGAYYYIKIIKVMYFDEPVEPIAESYISNTSLALYSINTLALLYLGLFPTGLVRLCLSAFTN